MHKNTDILHTRIDSSDAQAVVTPIFQNSAFESTSPYFYTRKNNPNVAELELVFSKLEEVQHAVCFSTGMAAIASVLHFLKPGDILVINQLIYGCSYKLFQRFCEQFSIQLHILNLSDGNEWNKIPDEVNMVIFETPTNPFLKTIDIQGLSTFSKKKNKECLIIVDNTWATPLFQQPLKLGADMAVYSATKYFSGHSDVMGGVVTTASEQIAQKLKDTRFYQGAILDPNSAWLLRRSMQTFHLRMKAHSEVTVNVRNWLLTHESVKKVYYPDVDGVQLTGYGTLLFFDFKKHLIDKYADFIAALSLFDTGTGMACVTSMVAKPFTGSHASMNDEEKKKMGIGHELVRLSIGLENEEDIIADLAQAFEKIQT